ncbi:MAG: ATP-binding protein [Zestosphaera sp.]
MALFDPRPKDRRGDLFDREEEVEELKKSVKLPLTLLLGVRRVGKTSVLRVALNELGAPYIYLDLRVLEEEGYSKVAFYRLLSEAFTNTASRWVRLLEYLKSIKGVEVYGTRVEFNWREESLTITRILNRLNQFGEREAEEGFLVVAFDEAQVLRNLIGGKGRVDFRSVLAYVYDNLPNLRFVLTGSEVGLLLDLLKLDDSSSPLYGRYVKTMRVERFDRWKSFEFLKRGFNEAGVGLSDDVLEAIVSKVDGIVGWLTYFGCLSVESGSPSVEAVNDVNEKALRLVEDELRGLFKRSRYYMHVLKAISLGMSTWSSIKKAVEAWLGRPLQNAQFTRLLETLVKLSIVEKADNEYKVLDPMIAEYCRRI